MSMLAPNPVSFETARINPPSHQQRLEQLRTILDRRDVAFPIDPDVAREYYENAAAGIPYEVGSLSDQSVDLGEFATRQEYDSIEIDDHRSWASLVCEQRTTKHRYACGEYQTGEESFEISGKTIPDYYLLNARIYQQTGWQLACVSMIIPAELFFYCHSRRFFPVTTFMRPLGTDYLEEPDIGHDIAGHVATFTIPQVAQVMKNHGMVSTSIRRKLREDLEAAASEEERARLEHRASELLLYAGRIYWYTVEFGLVMESNRVKAFGAGILSSPGETRYSVESTEPNRILIDPSKDEDLLRLATTDYLTTEFQKTYFVMKNFETLASLTPERILQTIHRATMLPHHTWREIVPGDQVIDVGRLAASPNEKYWRLHQGLPLDECMRRTAERNLRWFENPPKLREELRSFVTALPEVPQAA